MPYVPHTEDDTRSMLETIGAKSIDELFDEIPADLIIDRLKNIPAGLTEMQARQFFAARAKEDEVALNFIGAGAYEHHIPAAVWDLVSRGEFMTAYTPYQAEASQGGLQLLYEFQTMMASLTGLDVANASLYDAGSGLAEAVLMGVRANRRSKSKKVLVSGNIHPNYLSTLKNIVREQKISVEVIPFDQKTGQMTLAAFDAFSNDDIAAVVLPQTNFFGGIETQVDDITDWASHHNVLSIVVANPTAMAMLKSPGTWGEKGVDIVVGEGQPLGVPLASGGPYFGFLCCRQAHVRQMPGRIVGRTVDADGKVGFTLTLQAREQHIRRSKATSNICTNQGLLVTAATIYMSLLGAEGLRQVALASHQNTKKLYGLLLKVTGVEAVFDTPYFHEVAIRVSKPVDEVIEALAEQGIQGGYALKNHFPELDDAILVCATETKTEADLQAYADALARVLG